MENKQNLKPIEKMSSKELRAMCLELQSNAEAQDNKIASLNKIIERMTNERTFEEDVAEKGRKEAAVIRTRAIEQADEIVADARVAAEKIIECARISVYERKPEEINLPGADNLDLSGLLSNTVNEPEAEPKVEEAKSIEIVEEKELSVHQRILADYF